jgi:hypothetical protein
MLCVLSNISLNGFNCCAIRCSAAPMTEVSTEYFVVWKGTVVRVSSDVKLLSRCSVNEVSWEALVEAEED